MRARLDTRLVELGLAPSREKAKRLILSGAVRVNSQCASKPSDSVSEDAELQVISPERFVSRGGYKLERALDAFDIDCDQYTCLDIGASTGGFTDCLVQRGAHRVHAVDVGKGLLDWGLRQDDRVVVHEQLNARNISLEDIGEQVDLITVDVSFISLTKILPAACRLLKHGGKLIALIKPQFEAGRKFVKKGGVVRDPVVHERVKNDIVAFATNRLGLCLIGLVESPLLGPAGNKEFLCVLQTP